MLYITIKEVKEYVMWINHVNVGYKKPKEEFSPASTLVIVRVFAGFVFALLTTFIDYKGNVLNQAINIVPYALFAVCMVLFFKKRIEFRLWYVNGAIINIGALYYLQGLPISAILIDTIVILFIYLSPYMKEHYKKKGYVEVDISDV